MKKFQIRPLNYIINVECEKTTARRISNYLDLTGSDFNLSILYVYQESSYSRDCIRQKRLLAFIYTVTTR